MNKSTLLILMLSLVFIALLPAQTPEEGDLGITFQGAITGGDTRLGMTYFLSDKLALKPGIIVSFSSRVNEDKFNNTTDIETGATTGNDVNTSFDLYTDTTSIALVYYF